MVVHGQSAIHLLSCGCGFQDGRTDRQMLACEKHYRGDSMATLVITTGLRTPLESEIIATAKAKVLAAVVAKQAEYAEQFKGTLTDMENAVVQAGVSACAEVIQAITEAMG